MKKLALIFLLFVILLLSGLIWLYINVRPVSVTEKYINFNVPAGSNATQIGKSLYDQNLIRNPQIFKYYVQLSGISSNIQIGDYRLSPSFNLFQIVDKLSKAPLQVKVIIPEGFDNKEIASKFAKSLDQGQSFTSKFLEVAEGSEGYLFPDTYLVASNATPESIVAKMKSNFETRTAGLKITRDQLILASIIEKETKGVEERPVVAGILMNRLDSGMALQVDVAPETYKEPGLPAMPIANPGLISIKAALSPSETDYWYYLHEPSGVIHYAKTLDEHNANIQEYLR